MSKTIDLTWQKFNRLTIIKRTQNNNRGEACWLCLCNCGKETIVTSSHIRNNHTQSCGCLNKETTKTNRRIHGHSSRGQKSRIYVIWVAMNQRCNNPNNKRYEDYGGRDIHVCERWRKFQNFLDDMGNPPTDKHQIDRINNNGNYCKSNCRWVTSKINNRNRRNNRLETYGGRTQCLTAWAEELNIREGTLRRRIYQLNWSIKEAFTTPVR